MTPEKLNRPVDDKFNTMDPSLSPLKVYGILSEDTLGVFAFDGQDLCTESSMEDLKRRLLTNSCIDTADLILLQNGVKYSSEEKVVVAKERKTFKLFAFVRADSIRSTIEFVINPKSSEPIKKVVVAPNTRVDELLQRLDVGKLILSGCLMKECALIGDYVLKVVNRSNHISRDKRPFQLLALGVPKQAGMTGDQKTRQLQKHDSSLPTAAISKLKPCKIPPIRPGRSCTARFKGLQPMRRTMISRDLLRGLVASSLTQIGTHSVLPMQEATSTPVSSPNK